MDEEAHNGSAIPSEAHNGSAIPSKELAVVVVDEEEPMVGPGPAPRAKRKRPLQFEQAYLDSLPSANM